MQPDVLSSQARDIDATLKPRWNWRRLFPLGFSPPEYARIATTPATVRPAHGAAIVEVEKDEIAPLARSRPHAYGQATA